MRAAGIEMGTCSEVRDGGGGGFVPSSPAPQDVVVSLLLFYHVGPFVAGASLAGRGSSTQMGIMYVLGRSSFVVLAGDLARDVQPTRDVPYSSSAAVVLDDKTLSLFPE